MINIPESDQNKMREFYEQMSRNGLKLSGSEFLNRITSADCWSRDDESKWLSYIERETHYHIENDGWKWIQEENRFRRHSMEVSQEQYGKERDRVINAYVRLIAHQLSHEDRYKCVDFIPSLEGAISMVED